ncbi:conserved hypothetical protein [Cupriavidus taiwanensis]|uniref:Uncharacterized protein n=1 Tax=Cupriavidus taiwanensis TaxID=164546 RepID=A0A375JB77_9BURK|nr:conserved hypothetical protein [Cupriavidus taiwanensis]
MAAEKSLRSMVEKWLTPSVGEPPRVIGTGRLRDCRSRFVCVECNRATGTLSIMFFRHCDGGWYVFPPVTSRAGGAR